MVTKDEAIANAQEWFDNTKADAAISTVDEHAWGWMLFYESKEYLATGDIHQRLFGNVPVFVTRDDGVLHMSVAGSGTPPQKPLQIFERKIGIRKPWLAMLLAALAFLLFLWGLVVRDAMTAVLGGVMAVIFGLQWIGVPIFVRTKSALELKEKR